MRAAEPEDVLRFWFDPAAETDLAAAAAQSERWFGSDAAFDARIRERFGDLPERGARGELDAWQAEPRSTLALVLALDQFPRNLHRGAAQSFQYDTLACAVANQALARSFDARLAPLEAVFLYLPFEHAEDRAAQERSVALFEALRARAPEPLRAQFESFLSFAIRHREVIACFGRFPRRNEALGRTSTPEERAYLETGGDAF